MVSPKKFRRASKRKAISSPSAVDSSSAIGDSPPISSRTRKPVQKHRRQRSPTPSDSEHPTTSAMATTSKAKGKKKAFPKAGTGLQEIAALISNHESLQAARQETILGAKKSTATSTNTRMKAKAGSRAAATDDGFRVGKIVFLISGIRRAPQSNNEEDYTPQAFYVTRSEVDVGPNALIALMQCGLCVCGPGGYFFNKTDSFETIDNKLREEFPLLFQHFDNTAPELEGSFEATLSPWLVCSKRTGHKPGVVVYSDDRKRPDGLDIVTASQLGKAKVNFNDCTLFLVTRRPITMATVTAWQKVSIDPELQDYLDAMSVDSDYGSDNPSGPGLGIGFTWPPPNDDLDQSSSSPSPFPLAGPGPTTTSNRRRAGLARRVPSEDVINLLSDSDDEPSRPRTPHDENTLHTPPPNIGLVNQVSTPIYVPQPQREAFFSMSMLQSPSADAWDMEN